MSTAPTTEDLRKLISRLDPNCIRCFQGATSLCQSRSHFEITPEHLLLRLLDETAGDVTRIFDTFKVDFYAISFTFGLTLKINFMSMLMVLLVIVYLRWWYL